MRRVINTERFGPTDLMVGVGSVGVYASHFLGRRVQALISDWREADT